ncbi:MAG: molybdopterin cofactor-binding domain-containing protein, partial [Pseudomonadota bacterium]
MTPPLILSRRDALKGGAITLGFALGGWPLRASAQGLPERLEKLPRLDAWLRIGGDGRVTLFTGKVEFGQGIKTALAQIVADELDVALARLEVVTADTARTPDEGFTIGSLSVQQSGPVVRQAAAELRHHLLAAAGQRLNKAPHQLTVEDGHIVNGQGLSYWRLAADLPRDLAASGSAVPKAATARRQAGKPLPRLDIPAKVFGEPAFLHDIRLPGMLHGRVVRPPHYDALLEDVDLAPAKAMPGVIAVVRDGRFLGVVAQREEQAVKAADVLAAGARWRTDKRLPDTATLTGELIGHPRAEHRLLAGQADAPRGSGTRVRASYVRPYQAHAALSPSIAIAQLSEGRLTVWSHSQGVFGLRAAMADALAMSVDQIRVIHAEGAGCYGHNGADDAALDAALLSRAADGRPVRVQWSRADEFRWEPYGSAMAVELAASVTADGHITGWDCAIWGHSHSSRPWRHGGNLLAAQHLATPQAPLPPADVPPPSGGLDRNAIPYYRLPGQRVVKRFIPESPLRVSALRGLGAYANIFAIESFIDELAHAAGQDPALLRLAHLEDARARAVVEDVMARAGWFEKSSAPYGRGLAFARYKNVSGYLACVAFVQVEQESGRIQLERVVASVDVGEVVNPDGLRNQVEGGIIQSASWTLHEEVKVADGAIASEDWASYPILTFPEAPQVEVFLIDQPLAPFLGAGEVAQGPVAAAIANAVFDATGARLRHLPLTPDKVKAALAA